MTTENRAYCYLCEKGFATLDDIQKHNHESISEHQRLLATRPRVGFVGSETKSIGDNNA